MDHLYGGMEEIFRNTNSSQDSHSYVLGSRIMIRIIILSQQIRMFWYPIMQIQDWDKYKNFWNTLSLLSIDILSTKFQFINETMIFVICIISITGGLFIIISLLKYFRKKISPILIYIERTLFMILCEGFFIAIINTLLAIIKYSLIQYSTVQEYSSVNQNMYNFGAGGVVGSVVLLIVVMLLTSIYNAGTCEIRQSLDNGVTTAKSSVLINQFASLILFANSFMYFFIGYDYYEAYLIILFVLYGSLAKYYAYNLPCYSFYINLTKLFFQVDCMLMIFAFWLGFLLNNAGIPFLVTIVLQAILLILSYALIKYRISKINTDPESYYSDFEKYELSIRNFLKSGELVESLILKMNKNFKYDKNQLNIIFQAYYCNDVLQNFKLAYNKIIGLKYHGFDIFLNFQIFKCRTIMTNLNKHSSELYKIYQYFINVQNLKLKDCTFCETYSKLLEAIITPNPNLLNLKTKINKLTHQKRALIELYILILDEFPNSAEVNEMYGSFLVDIFCDIDKGQIYLNKILTSKKLNESDENSNTINNRGLAIISGNPQNIGKILYANKSFISFSIESIQTYSFSNLIPSLFSKEHDNLLMKFTEDCTDVIVYRQAPLFLVDYQGFLCECFIGIECIGDNDSVNFLCKIDPIVSTNREIAVIDLSGFIYSHSTKFIRILGFDQIHAENMNIQYYLTDIVISELQLDKIYEIEISNDGLQQDHAHKDSFIVHRIKTIWIILKCCNILHLNIYALYLTDDPNQAISWRNLEDFYTSRDNQNENEKKTEDNPRKKVKKIPRKKEIKIIEESKQYPKIDTKHIHKDKDTTTNKITNPNSDSHSNSVMILDKNEEKAVYKSSQVLKISKVLLFVSVIYN